MAVISHARTSALSRARVDWTLPAWSVFAFVAAMLVNGAALAFSYGAINARVAYIQSDVSEIKRVLYATARRP